MELKHEQLVCEKQAGCFFQFARHGRALMGASPEHAQVVGNV